MELNTLNHFYYPKSIAIVGASDDPGKAGYQITRNLLDLGFAGPIYPVNPHKKEVLGLPCYSDLRSAPGALELVIITVPAFEVPAVLRQAAARGDVRAAVIIASGFSETKIPERVQLEEEVVAIAKGAGIRLMGPNCVGVMNTQNHLDTTFAAGIKQVPGGMSVLSQSGALGAAIMMLAGAQPVPMGFNKWAHVGNQSDVNLLEILRYYGQDPATRVIAMYMEGVDDGRSFLEVAQGVAREKPIIILKVGRSEVGSGAAASHTGSLAGSDQIYDAVFHQAGILRAATIEDLLDTSKALAMQPLPRGNKMVVLTEAGGPGIIAVDELGLSPYVEMADLQPETKEKLKAILPPMALVDHARGYVDMSAAATEHHHAEALTCVLDDPGVDGVVLLSVPPTFLQPRLLAEKIVRVVQAKPGKSVVVCLLGGEWVREACQLLEKEGIPTYDVPDRGARALARMAERAHYLRKPEQKTAGEGIGPGVLPQLEQARQERRNPLEPEAGGILSAYGIPTARSILARDLTEGLTAAAELGYPVVLKIVSPDILHKSDAGGVKIGIRNSEELEAAYHAMMASVVKYNPQARIVGILVSSQAAPGVEVIVGAKRDPQFGPVVMFGLGGIFVEVFKDVVFRVAPVTAREAGEMIRGIKGYPLLAGARGQVPCDLESLARIITGVSDLMLAHPEIAEIDLNPVVVYAQGALALDARIILAGG